MAQDKKFKNISKNFVTDDTDYMTAFRHNVLLYIADSDITINDLAEWSGLSVDTLKSFVYKGSKDCKLSTAVALAKALDVSIDELVGASTVNPITRENIAICRNLPDNALYLIRWFIKHQQALSDAHPKGQRFISVMRVKCSSNGNLKLTNDYEQLEITPLNKEITCKTFFGIKLPCEHYMPHYSPYDILLIANDRPPMFDEDSIIVIDGSMHIARRKVECGIAKYYSIRDRKYRIDEKDVDEVVGYICDVYR